MEGCLHRRWIYLYYRFPQPPTEHDRWYTLHPSWAQAEVPPSQSAVLPGIWDEKGGFLSGGHLCVARSASTLLYLLRGAPLSETDTGEDHDHIDF